MGEIADEHLERWIFRECEWDEEYWDRKKKTATEVAEDLLKDRNKSGGAKAMNKGVIEW